MACGGCARRREKMRRAFAAAKAKLGFTPAPEPAAAPSNEPAVGHAINQEGRVTRVVRVQ
jgi:hypothetical protein